MWVAEQSGPEMILPKILPGAEYLIAYHVVTEGRCFGYIVGVKPITVEAGEVIVFTKGEPHIMSSEPGMRGDPFSPSVIDAVTTGQLPLLINFGGSALRPNWSAASSRATPGLSIRCSQAFLRR
jgi:hypothetical protein